MYQVKEGCPGCGACQAVCSVDAIIPGDGLAVFITEKCIDCGLCAGSCPVGLIEKAVIETEIKIETTPLQDERSGRRRRVNA